MKATVHKRSTLTSEDTQEKKERRGTHPREKAPCNKGRKRGREKSVSESVK